MENPALDGKVRFDKYAAALGLDTAERDWAWRALLDCGMEPNQPASLFVVVAGILRLAGKTLPGQIEDAARRATGEVADAAAARVAAAQAELASQVGEQVASAAEATLDRRQEALNRLAVRSIAATVAVVLLGAVVIGGGVGYGWGRAETADLGREWAALASRADAAAWVRLAEVNPDLRAALREACGPGGPNRITTGGTAACNVPLWLEGAVAAPRGAGGVTGIWRAILDSLAEWSPLVLLGVGFGVATVGRKMARLTLRWLPLRWLLDLED